jgi:hypothetical protein
VPPAPATPAKNKERFWLQTVAVKISRWTGSLQVAVFLLTLFAAVLIVGTIVESWYDGKIAQQLVYRTWWFTLLLALLGANIFFAAAKKWPWKKHQTGFLITHVGLLLLVAGGILNSAGGTDAQMPLVDSDDPQYFSQAGPHVSHEIVDQDVFKIKVRQPHKSKDKVAEYDFQPGPMVWTDDEYIHAHVDRLAGFLNWLAHPFPRSWQVDLGEGARLQVLNSYPNCRTEKFGPVRSDETPSFPAVQFELASPRAGVLSDRWVAYHDGDEVFSIGPAMVEFLGQDLSPELLAEFAKPPRPGQTGSRGQLVVWIAKQRFRVDVAEGLNAGSQPLGDTGWRVRFYDVGRSRDEKDIVARPAVAFDLTGPGDRQFRLGLRGRKPADLIQGHTSSDLNNVQVWYHPPDYRYGLSNVRGLLQIVTGKDGQIHYRSFNSSKGPFEFETAGTIKRGEKSQGIWEGMNWKFQVTQFIPKAEAGPYFVPIDRRLGLEDGNPPALRCRLSVGQESKEFWLAKQFFLSKEQMTWKGVEVAGKVFELGYCTQTRAVDFEITLLRAETTTDKGTGHPATYTSYVQLTGKNENITGEPRVIYMNHPLNHGGYKLYQSGLNFVAMDENEKPVNQSVFAVGKDPGLWFKYTGSTMLALGIACMFYMKAYFFKPRRRFSPAGNGVLQRTAIEED